LEKSEFLVLEEVPFWHEEDSVLNAITDAVGVIGIDGTIIQTNEAVLHLFKVTKEECIGKKVFSFIAEEDRKKCEKILQCLLKKGVQNSQFKGLRKDGTTFPAEINSSLLRASSGKPSAIVGVIRDITSRVAAEEQIRRHSHELSALMKSSTKIIRTKDLRQRLKVIAEAIKRLGWRRVVISVRDENLEITDLVTAGLTSEEVKILLEKKSPGHVWRERLGPNVQRYKIGEFYYLPWMDPQVREQFWKISSKMPPEEAIEHIAGVPSRISPEEMIDWHPQDTLYAPLQLPKGRIVGILSMDDPLDGRRPTKESLAPLELFIHQAGVAVENAQLIKDLETARNQVREYAEKLESKVEERTRELTESEKKYSTLVEHANDGIVIIQDGKVSFASKRIEELTGYRREELVGNPFLEMLPQSEVEFVKSRYEKRLEGKPVPAIYESKALSKNGDVIPVEVNIAVTDYNGKPASLVIVRDIRKRKKMEEKLLKTEKLAAIGELAASVGHDLRNPLTGIRGAVYYLKMKLASRMDRRSREMLSIIEGNVEYSNKIVNDLLDYSREIYVQEVRVSVKSLLDDVLTKIQIPKKIKVLNLTRDVPKVSIDAAQIKRVFGNLVKNAIDAMPEGGKLEITSKRVNDTLTITLQDTGIGIPSQNFRRLFTPLFTTKAKGVGLGLAICKRIIDAHGGSINIKSEEGTGTCVTVTLRIKKEK